METKATFVELEAMVRSGSLVLAMPELANSFQFLEEKGLITTAEREALLELAKRQRENEQVPPSLDYE